MIENLIPSVQQAYSAIGYWWCLPILVSTLSVDSHHLATDYIFSHFSHPHED